MNKFMITDAANGLQLVLSSSGGYAPDIMNDLKNRAIEGYKEALHAAVLEEDFAKSLKEKGDEDGDDPPITVPV